MTLIQPLDLEYIFVNTFAGSSEIFIFLAFMVIMALSAMFRMPNVIALVMFAIFGSMFAVYSADFQWLIVLGVGIALYYGIRAVTEK